MKSWIYRFIALVCIGMIGFWAWQTFFPSPEKIIRSKMKELSKLATFDSSEGGIGRMASVMKLAGLFTTDAQCIVSSPDVGSMALNGRNEIRDAALAARSRLSSMRVDLLDIAITFAPDNQTATADLTIRVGLASDKDFFVKQAKFTLTKVDGDWLISRAETVNTFL